MRAPDRPLTRTDVMTADEVAQLLQIARNTVLEWARNGTLPAMRRGRIVRFRRWEIEAFVRGDLDTNGATHV